LQIQLAPLHQGIVNIFTAGGDEKSAVDDPMDGIAKASTSVGRCRLPISKTVLKALMVSALETKTW